MELRHLRYFVAVAEERHFSRAAARLHVAQPPLSQQIKQLEEHLDTQLLVRTTRKVDLTPAGQLFLDRARSILGEIERLEDDTRLVGRGARGVLRLGVVGSATYRLVSHLLSTTRQELPGVRLHVTGELLTPTALRMLDEGHLDVALLRPPSGGLPMHGDTGRGKLKVRRVSRDPLVAALPADHPLASCETLRMADFAGVDIVSYPPDSAVHAISAEAARRAEFSPRIVQEAGETATLLALVSAGVGIALVPVTHDGFTLRGVVLRPVTDAPTVDLAAAWRSTGEPEPLLDSFLTLLPSAGSVDTATSLDPAGSVHATEPIETSDPSDESR
ncbi:LysR substrate-binding domain-containing protein [Brevibacterium litoralis]|uniref:LysR substrate-binding domain-containing protein n=1 Tax=Brevibacterium litoralis TaxID=3138935 RepID=UPI0032EDE527